MCTLGPISTHFLRILELSITSFLPCIFYFSLITISFLLAILFLIFNYARLRTYLSLRFNNCWFFKHFYFIVEYSWLTVLCSNCWLGGLALWLSGSESACQCRRHRLTPWSGKHPHAMEHVKPGHHNYCICALEPGSHNYWSPPL